MKEFHVFSEGVRVFDKFHLELFADIDLLIAFSTQFSFNNRLFQYIFTRVLQACQ